MSNLKEHELDNNRTEEMQYGNLINAHKLIDSTIKLNCTSQDII